MMKRLGWAVWVLLFFGSAVFAQRSWEGSATVARYGEFPPTGLFGASNSFERNSIVEVENLGNGKTARIIITGPTLDPTQFLALSDQAAAELGIGRTDVARVRVSPVVTPIKDPTVLKPETPKSPDPDINPAARVAPSAATSDALVPTPSISPSAPVSPATPATPVAPAPPAEPTAPASSPAPAPALIAETPASAPSPKLELPAAAPPASPPSVAVPMHTPSKPGAEEPAKTSDTGGSGIEKEVSSPSPSPPAEKVSLPWKEPDVENPYARMEASFALRDKEPLSGLKVALPDPDAAAVSKEEPPLPPPTRPSYEMVSAMPLNEVVPETATEEEEETDETTEAVVEAKEDTAEKEPEAAVAEKAEETPEDTDVQVETHLTLEPAQPKPPVPVEPVEKEAPVVSKAPPSISPSPEPALPFRSVKREDLEKGAFYLQLGSFSKPKSAETLWERFRKEYPMVIVEEGKSLRVLVGPLKNDERGVVYQAFRTKGWKDAFFVKIE